MKNKIVQVVVGLPVEGPFDYEVKPSDRDRIAVGHRVNVPFGRRQVTAYVTALLTESQIKNLKQVTDILDAGPVLDSSALRLAKEISLYYGCSWGEAIEAGLPAYLRGRKTTELKIAAGAGPEKNKTSELILHLDSSSESGREFLAGKIRTAFSNGRGILILAPEISQVEEIRMWAVKELGLEVTVFDKHLTPKKEYESWAAVREGRSRLVIGTRSAVFAPVQNPGLIIVFNDDNPSFKQEQSPFYSAVQAAWFRREIEGVDLIFSGATPSVEIYQRIQEEKGDVVRPEPRGLAELKVIDLTNYKSRRWTALSFPLQSEVETALQSGKKVLLYHNKRGFTTKTSCNQCGHIVRCKRCDANMIYLYSHKKLVCPLCDSSEVLPKVCPACKGSYIRSTGKGIEKMESDLARLFPSARIDVCDRETERYPSGANLVIGTQATLKFLRRARVDLLGVIDADRELNRMDFRSSQRFFSLLVYLRQAVKGKVIVQTGQMDHYALKAAVKFDFDGFYGEELGFRRETEFPPFKHLIEIGLRGREEPKVFDHALGLYEALKKGVSDGDMEVMEPLPNYIPKLRDKYRFIIMVKAADVREAVVRIRGVLKTFSKGSVVVTVNVDP